MMANEINTALKALALKLRQGKHVEACLVMVNLFDGLLPHLANSEIQQKQKFHHYVKEILMAQERQDWLCMADYLEYEMIALLNDIHLE